MGGEFLQSTEWERIQRHAGRRTWRAENILIIRHDLPLGFNYLYCGRPHLTSDFLHTFLYEVQKIAAREKSIFLKIDPAEKLFFDTIHARIAYSTPLQPQETTLLNLSESANKILGAMHEKTRYNIRLAERKGIEIIQSFSSGNENDFEVFWRLLYATSDRSEFGLHEKQYYQILLNERDNNFSTELFFAMQRGKHKSALAAAMINFYRDARTGEAMATYLHGGSSREHKELMAPHLLHWRIIEEAQKRGMAHYDLWGIDEVLWHGVTRFKKGFGGKHITYPPSAHIIYRPFLYRIYEARKHST